MRDSGRRTPTCAADRWAEIVETSHEGMALVDRDGRIGFVSDTFAATYGVEAEALTGTDLVGLLPGLGVPSSGFAAVLERGTPVRLEMQRRGVDGRTRSIRLTLVPRPRDHAGSRGLIAVVRDVTDLRRAQRERRRAQQRLTAVEEELRRRVEREIHDGPIQILAALALRITTNSGVGLGLAEPNLLGRSIDEANGELRRLIGELTASDRETTGAKLQRWAAPLLSGTSLSVTVIDRLTTRPDRATTEALFVLLHEVIVASAASGSPRKVSATISEDDGGHRLTIEIDAVGPRWHLDATEIAQIHAARGSVRAMGGALDVAWAVPNQSGKPVHTFSAWLPRPGTNAIEIAVSGPTVKPTDDVGAWSSAGATNPLDESDWEALAGACHEGLLELDGDLVITFVNGAYAAAMRRPAPDMVGRPFSEVFAPDDYERLKPYVDKVVAGNAIRFDWQRRNAIGEPRWTQVSASPRSDAEGAFAGALVVTLDTTEFHHTIDLAQDVYDQIEQTRRRVTHDIALRLREGPLERLEAVSSQLMGVAPHGPVAAPVKAIRDELDRSIVALRDSFWQLAEPNLADQDWSSALRESVAPLLASTRTTLSIHVDALDPRDVEHASTMIRVAREAVANAVLHGRADHVHVSLVEYELHDELSIADDGVGIAPDAPLLRPGHLGIRSMRERVADCRGTLTIEPGPDGGTVVVARLPKSTTVPVADEP